MILLDTSVLIDALTGSQRLGPGCGPCEGESDGDSLAGVVRMAPGASRSGELALQEALFPSDEAVSFGPSEAIGAAELYRSVGR